MINGRGFRKRRRREGRRRVVVVQKRPFVSGGGRRSGRSDRVIIIITSTSISISIIVIIEIMKLNRSRSRRLNKELRGNGIRIVLMIGGRRRNKKGIKIGRDADAFFSDLDF